VAIGTQSRIGVEIIGLEQVENLIGQLANLLGTDNPVMYDILWDTGEEMRRQCQLMCTQVVYNSPPSPTYTRTGFLREAMFITVKRRTDYSAVKARAQALARAVYPKRNISNTYRMVNPTPFPALRAVRLTSGSIYSDYVEYGTEKMGPRPFMRAGIESGESRIVAVATSGITRAISDIQRRRVVTQPRNRLGQFASRT
jgi:hypothetical protein